MPAGRSADHAGASAARGNNGFVGALRRVEVDDHARRVVLQFLVLRPGAFARQAHERVGGALYGGRVAHFAHCLGLVRVRVRTTMDRVRVRTTRVRVKVRVRVRVRVRGG